VEDVMRALPHTHGLAGRSSLRTDDVRFAAVVFGAGDFRVRTEDRHPPPRIRPGDRFVFGRSETAGHRPLYATIDSVLGHPRLVGLRFDHSPDQVWAGLARYARPVQYAYVTEPLALWDVWTSVAAVPVAFEPPSAGFMLDWNAVAAMNSRNIDFATLTLAAGLSSTGDIELDRRLPFDEPYRISQATADAIRRTRRSGGRIVAVGTTVVRALEHAEGPDGTVQSGDGVANQ
jgi:S-adenosylmethionine:tRNA ribosyltransferase-isomerase